jgi:hypothetical protein
MDIKKLLKYELTRFYHSTIMDDTTSMMEGLSLELVSTQLANNALLFSARVNPSLLFPPHYCRYIKESLMWASYGSTSRQDLDKFEAELSYDLDARVDVPSNSDIDAIVEPRLSACLEGFPKDNLEERTRNLISGVVCMYLFTRENTENYSERINHYTDIVEFMFLLCKNHPPEYRVYIIRFVRCISLFLYYEMKEDLDKKILENNIQLTRQSP